MTTSAPAAPHATPAIPADHGVVVTSRWQVADRHAQRTTADAAMAGWQHLPWPDGCLSIACLLSTDGHLVLFYAQWANTRDYQRHVESSHGEHAEGRVGGIEPAATVLDTTVSRLAGASGSRSGDGPFPGCVALVTIATDGPDRQRQAAESIAAFSADAHPGAIGGHVLFSLDGTRVTLYAEWTSEQAHREAIASSAFGGQRGIFDGKSGIRGLSMNRYQLYRSVTPPRMTVLPCGHSAVVAGTLPQ